MCQDPACFEERHLKYISLLGKVSGGRGSPKIRGLLILLHTRPPYLHVVHETSSAHWGMLCPVKLSSLCPVWNMGGHWEADGDPHHQGTPASHTPTRVTLEAWNCAAMTLWATARVSWWL